ncbi:MAG: hypothetical protein LBG57_05320 [Treponema sp.]|jgi:hypothetical protein|nr:hypothetical protein [Treponema sp.]
MTWKIFSLIVSMGAIVLGIFLSLNTSRLFYGLILAGVLYGIYDIYVIATHKRKTQEQQEAQRKLAKQKTFNDTPPTEITNEPGAPAAAAGQAEFATIIVNWYKEKMGAGCLSVSVNGAAAGVIKKGNLQVTYHTNVSFNVISIGIYKTEIELSPGDTVEYFAAGNGIHHDRTILTKGAK